MYSVAGYPFSWLNNIWVCVHMHIMSHLYSFISGYIGYFYTLFIINSAVNVEVRVFFEIDFIFFAYIPRSGIAKSNGRVLFHGFFFITS